MVYAATHDDTGRLGALKLARSDGSAISRHWFAREASLAARLRHPHVVELIEHGTTEAGRPYLVYEHVDGAALEEVAEDLSLVQIVRLGSELLDALGYAHDAGIVHCDVTPGNVLLAGGAGGAAKLTDFGLAKAREDSRARRLSGDVIVSGTPGYLSPEQARGVGSPGPSSDLFGCGAVLFRALTGYAPYGGDSPMEVVQHTLTTSPLPLRPRSGLRAPVHLAEVVQRLISRDPEHRYPCAALARRAWMKAALTHTPIAGAVRPLVPVRPGLQSMETIFVQTLRTAPQVREAAFSTMRATPAGGLDRRPFRSRFAPSRLERPELLETIASSLLPHPSCIVGVTGPEGGGKSDLVEAVRDALRERGVRVCFARARQGGRCAPFEALAAAMIDAIGAAQLQPLRLAAELLLDRIHDAGAGDAAWGCDALIGGLVGIGPSGARGSAVMEAFTVCEALLDPDRRPVVIVLADADGVDEGTWEVVRALVQRPGGGIGVVWAARDRAPGDDEIHIELQLPDDEAIAAAWKAWSGSSTAPPEGVRNPADLRALAALGDRAGVSGFDDYLESIEPPERALLEVAAVFGGDVPERGLVKVAGLVAAPHVVSEEVLLGMKRSRLLVEVDAASARRERWVRAPSPGLRERVLARMVPDERMRVQGLAAQWLSRDCFDESSATLSRIAELAMEAGMPGSAAHAWSEAGRIELDSGRPLGAAPFFRRALTLAVEGAAEAVDRPRIATHLALAALAAGEPARADERAKEAWSMVEPERNVLRARIAHARGDAAVQEGRLEDSLVHLRCALEELGDDGDPMELARAHALLGWVLGYRLGRNEEGIAHGRRALDVAARIGAPAFRASLCGRLGANYLRAGDWDGQLATNREDLRLSSEARDVGGIVRANINLGVCFTNRGDLALAREHTETALSIAKRCGVAGAAQIADNNLAMIALDDGRAADVEAHAAEVFEGAERTGYRRALPETLITCARLHVARGELDAAEEKLARASEAGDVADLEMAHRAWALLELARDLRGEALARMQKQVGEAEHDPYERASSRITYASALRGAGREDDAVEQEAMADRVFERLGADPALERRRWA